MSASIATPIVMPKAGPGPVALLLKRLHFHVGLFIGPFLLIAALSGVLYALTPQIEDRLYAQALHTDARGPALSLAEQVQRAQDHMGPHATVAALRPAPEVGDTTRVMFNAPALGEGEHRAVFIDPVSGAVRGDLIVYGTGGVLPLRTWIDQLHRSLLLGDIGRLYSELAASWLWVAALGGLWLWAQARRARRRAVARSGLRGWHSTLGLWLSLGLLFFSVTGLTWSQYAGDNIGVLRAHYGWSTPSVKTALSTAPAMDMAAGEHAMHMKMPATATQAPRPTPALFDAVLATARTAGISAAKVEVRPATRADKAWVVSEIDRRWPTRVDAASIDPQALRVVDHVRFADYSLAAKLTRWGIDAHMGALFGVANQVVLVLIAGGLLAMVVMGYWMWWQRRPVAVPLSGLVSSWRQCGRGAQVLTLSCALAVGWALPVLGVSLLGFVVADGLLGLRRGGAPSQLTRRAAGRGR